MYFLVTNLGQKALLMRYWPMILCIHVFYDNLDKIMVTKVNKVCIQFEAHRLWLIPSFILISIL